MIFRPYNLKTVYPITEHHVYGKRIYIRMGTPLPSVHGHGQRCLFLLWNPCQAVPFGRTECTGFRCISGKGKHVFYHGRFVELLLTHLILK